MSMLYGETVVRRAETMKDEQERNRYMMKEISKLEEALFKIEHMSKSLVVDEVRRLLNESINVILEYSRRERMK